MTEFCAVQRLPSVEEIAVVPRANVSQTCDAWIFSAPSRENTNLIGTILIVVWCISMISTPINLCLELSLYRHYHEESSRYGDLSLRVQENVLKLSMLFIYWGTIIVHVVYGFMFTEFWFPALLCAIIFLSSFSRSVNV
jgi:hypothetical protein